MKTNKTNFVENDTQFYIVFSNHQNVGGLEVDIYSLICGILFYK